MCSPNYAQIGIMANSGLDARRTQTNEIRYFHLEDKPEAQRIGEAVEHIFEIPSPNVKFYDDTKAPPQYIELWIAQVP